MQVVHTMCICLSLSKFKEFKTESSLLQLFGSSDAAENLKHNLEHILKAYPLLKLLGFNCS